MGNSRSKEFLGFKLHAVPSSVRSSLPPPLCPARSVAHAHVRCPHAVRPPAHPSLSSPLGHQVDRRSVSAVSKSPLPYFIMPHSHDSHYRMLL